LQALLAKRTSFKQAEFAKALTCIERLGSHSLQFKELLSPKKPAYRIGITGPPGAGKSTLIAALIKALRAKGKRVGVLAVDPSSPFTNGALLGDRIRFSESFTDPGVFIRSIHQRSPPTA
jgi:LAO/AO transport system kinase